MLMADNVRAVDLRTRVHAQTVSEQAFYASQSCLEEGFYQLRTNETYSGTTTVTVGSSTCTVTPVPDPSHPTNGQLTSTGNSGSSMRTIAAGYHDAGATIIHLENDIVHVIDRSGSMGYLSCTKEGPTNQVDCGTAGGQWLTKLAQAQAAATNFTTIDLAAPSVDKIGVVSYSKTIKVERSLTNSASAVNTAINALVPDVTTNIGGAITTASSQLQPGAAEQKFMILLTDGIPNEPNGECAEHHMESCDYAITAATTAKDTMHQHIIVIGLGNDVNATLLKQIASPKSDGQPWYYFAPSAAALQGIYTDIARQISQYNIGQGSWNEQ
jgi:hypothetical protein